MFGGPAGALLLIGLGVATSRAAAQQHPVAHEDVTFSSDSLQLAGTLYRPTDIPRAPAVVLIHGSGATDRATLRYYAELVARNGITALAYDKRGIGQSQGDKLAWRYFSLTDLAKDAASGVRFLRSRADVDSTRVGLFGASQGGWVAPLAAQMLGVRFVVSVSASLTTIAEDNLFERSSRLQREGFSPGDVEAARRMHLLDLELSRTGSGFDAFSAAWTTNQSAPWFKRVYLDAKPAPADHPYRRWYRTVMDVDPVPVWRAISAPALFLFGDPMLDHSSPVARSIDVLEELRASGRDVTVLSFPGADHALQRSGTGVDITGTLMSWLNGRLAEPPR